jgi:hypothetical protein
MKLIWAKIFSWGVLKGDTSLIWGYTKGRNFDLVVRKYQMVENPCYI